MCWQGPAHDCKQLILLIFSLPMKIVARFFAWPNCRRSPGSSQILWTKLCASGLDRAHLLDFPQQTSPALFLSAPGARRNPVSRQLSSHFLWTKL
jgi:hypothetical protein